MQQGVTDAYTRAHRVIFCVCGLGTPYEHLMNIYSASVASLSDNTSSERASHPEIIPELE